MYTKRLAVLAAGLILLAGAAHASQYRFYLAEEHDWGARQGFYLDFENGSEEGSPCKLETLRLLLGVADGKVWRYLHVPCEWEFNREYEVRAVIAPEKTELWFDGKLVGESEGGFAPHAGSIRAAEMPDWANAGTTEYLILQTGLEVSSSEGTSARADFGSYDDIPLPLLLFEPARTQAFAWELAPAETMTLNATFRIVPYPHLRDHAPFVDRYGQAVHAEWDGKIRSDEDLVRSRAEEEERLAAMPPLEGYDRFGGCQTAGWSEEATGFFRVIRRDGFWWLISPEGNPCFYTGVSSIPAITWSMTPVTGREYLFEALPEGPGWGTSPWGEAEQIRCFALHTPNLIRKYGKNDWQNTASPLAVKRLKAWGFSGGGKWGSTGDIPHTPVLGVGGVPLLDRHIDCFDPAIRQAFEESIREQLTPQLDNPYVLGWTLGSEYDGIVTKSEVTAILGMGSGVPAKRAFVDLILQQHYCGEASAMGAAWGVDGRTVEALYNATPKPPVDDIEKLRYFYADAYHRFVYETFKKVDPNHLYLGFYIIIGWWENEDDWRISAKYCDVVSYDRYAPDFSDELMDRLVKEADKPIFCGEFSFPPFHDGKRGYGRFRNVSAKDAADAGDKYTRYVADGARNPWCVGVMWFQYRDQHITGRGPGTGGQLVIGEHYAFGLVDVADRPKWPMVERMRDTNSKVIQWRMQAMKP